jgi:small neutral amino acid transporter SnatA (MarC family)
MLSVADVPNGTSAIVFGTLTAKSDTAFRRQVAIKTVLTATIIIVLVIVAGEFLLQVFHISMPALKIAGGLTLLLFALHAASRSARLLPGRHAQGAAR